MISATGWPRSSRFRDSPGGTVCVACRIRLARDDRHHLGLYDSFAGGHWRMRMSGRMQSIRRSTFCGTEPAQVRPGGTAVARRFGGLFHAGRAPGLRRPPHGPACSLTTHQPPTRGFGWIARKLDPVWQRLRSRCSPGGRSAAWPSTYHCRRGSLPFPFRLRLPQRLAGRDGRLWFIDFEYAGWDDPAKTVCDFFCQPGLPGAASPMPPASPGRCQPGRRTRDCTSGGSRCCCPFIG